MKLLYIIFLCEDLLQEIRNCIYSGSLNSLLKELNKNSAWMKINKMKGEIGYRFTKQELILRLFAFHDQYRKFGRRLAKFLNEYMDDNKNQESGFIIAWIQVTSATD